MAEDPFVTVNVDRGMLEHFARPFLTRYGEESVFVRAVADVFTGRIADLMRQKGKLFNESTVRFVGSPDAAQVVRDLLRSLNQGASQTLLQEATGLQPIGTFRAVVENHLGSGRFDPWLEDLERVGAGPRRPLPGE